jgi:hypothetical protein
MLEWGKICGKEKFEGPLSGECFKRAASFLVKGEKN